MPTMGLDYRFAYGQTQTLASFDTRVRGFYLLEFFEYLIYVSFGNPSALIYDGESNVFRIVLTNGCPEGDSGARFGELTRILYQIDQLLYKPVSVCLKVDVLSLARQGYSILFGKSGH